jgi:hypothetical protein
MTARSAARPLLAFVLLAALAIAVVAHRIHIDRPDHYGIENWDLYRYIYPTAVFLGHELARGNLPLWNPYQYAGQPFVALPNAQLLYPPHLAFLLLLQPALALEAEFVFHLLIAGWFTWLLAGRMGLSTPARMAAALGYMLSGPLLFDLYMLPLICSEAWLPAILWAIHGLASESRPRWALALAGCLALSFLGGYPQGFLYEVQIAGVYGVFALFAMARRKARVRVVGLALLGGVLAFGLVAPQLLPTAELVAQGSRGFEGHHLADAARGSASPRLLLTGMLGQLGPDSTLAPGPMRRFLTLPVLALPLAAMAWMARRQRAHCAFLLAAALLSALFMLGQLTPVFGLYYSLPLGSLFRIPIRMTFAYTFFVCLLAAIGIEGLTERLAKLRLPARLPTVAAALLALLIGVDGYSRVELTLAHPVLPESRPRVSTQLLAYLRTRPDRQRMFIGDRAHMKADLELPFKFGTQNQVFVVPDYEPLLPIPYLRYFHTEGDALFHGTLSVLPRGRRWPAPVLARLLDLMSVRYYTLPRLNRGKYLQQIREFAQGVEGSIDGMPWIERASARPRAYSVQRVFAETSPEAALARITGDAFDPELDAVVEVPGPGNAGFPALEPASAPDAGPLAGRNRVRITAYETDAVAIEAACDGDCLLVLTDLHYPGWRVAVNGREQPVYRVNALFRGVRLGPGAHRIEFRFEPRTWRIGLGIFFATVLATALVATLGAWQRRGRHHPLRA